MNIINCKCSANLTWYHNQGFKIREFIVEKQAPLKVKQYWLNVRPPYRDWFKSKTKETVNFLVQYKGIGVKEHSWIKHNYTAIDILLYYLYCFGSVYYKKFLFYSKVRTICLFNSWSRIWESLFFMRICNQIIRISNTVKNIFDAKLFWKILTF